MQLLQAILLKLLNTENKMNIVCATDNNFVQHCSIMLSSLLSHNSNVVIYVLTEGLTKENEKIIKEEVATLGGKLNICLVDPEIVSKFPMPKDNSLVHISRATYYRLLLADLLPEEVQKVIYLDCDMIIRSSLDELWNTDLTSYALGAVLQIGSGFEAERLGYPVSDGYFNAGMNVINLDYFRRNKISSKLVQYLSDHYSEVIYHDQDALNAVLHDKTVHLAPKWNMMTFCYAYELDKRCDHYNEVVINNYTEEKQNVRKYKNNPCIIHYSANPKPWQSGCIHPLASLYFEYAKNTIYFNKAIAPSDITRYYEIFKHRIKEWLSSIKQRFVKTDRTRY